MERQHFKNGRPSVQMRMISGILLHTEFVGSLVSMKVLWKASTIYTSFMELFLISGHQIVYFDNDDPPCLHCEGPYNNSNCMPGTEQHLLGVICSKSCILLLKCDTRCQLSMWRKYVCMCVSVCGGFMCVCIMCVYACGGCVCL